MYTFFEHYNHDKNATLQPLLQAHLMVARPAYMAIYIDPAEKDERMAKVTLVCP